MTEPEAPPVSESRFHAAAFLGGGVLGFVGNGFVFLMAFLLAWSLSAEGEPSNDARDFAIMLGGALVLPVLCAVVVFRRGSPRVGRGFVVGALVGSLLVAALALPWFFGV